MGRVRDAVRKFEVITRLIALPTYQKAVLIVGFEQKANLTNKSI